MTDKELITNAEARGWKRLRWKDRIGRECTGWRSPDGQLCGVPPEGLAQDTPLPSFKDRGVSGPVGIV